MISCHALVQYVICTIALLYNITRSVARFARPLLACACISFVYTAWKVIAGPTLELE